MKCNKSRAKFLWQSFWSTHLSIIFLQILLPDFGVDEVRNTLLYAYGCSIVETAPDSEINSEIATTLLLGQKGSNASKYLEDENVFIKIEPSIEIKPRKLCLISTTKSDNKKKRKNNDIDMSEFIDDSDLPLKRGRKKKSFRKVESGWQCTMCQTVKSNR